MLYRYYYKRLQLFRLPYKTLLAYHVALGNTVRLWSSIYMNSFILAIRKNINILNVTYTIIQIRKALNALFNRIKTRGFLTIFAYATKALKINHIDVFSIVDNWVPGYLTNHKWVNGSLIAYKKYMAESKILLKRSQLKAVTDTYQKSIPQSFFVLKKRKKRRHPHKFPCISLSILDGPVWLHECNCLRIPSIQICDTQSHLEKVTYPIIANQRSVGFSRLILDLAVEVTHVALASAHLSFISFYKNSGKKLFTRSLNKQYHLNAKVIKFTFHEKADEWSPFQYRWDDHYRSLIPSAIKRGLKEEAKWYLYYIYRAYRRPGQRVAEPRTSLKLRKRSYIYNKKSFTYDVKGFFKTKTLFTYFTCRPYTKLLRHFMWEDYRFLKRIHDRLLRRTKRRRARRKQLHIKLRPLLQELRKTLNERAILYLKLRKALKRKRRQKRIFLNQIWFKQRTIRNRVICSYFPQYLKNLFNNDMPLNKLHSLKSSHNSFYKNISSILSNTPIHMNSNLLGGLNTKISTSITSSSHKVSLMNTRSYSILINNKSNLFIIRKECLSINLYSNTSFFIIKRHYPGRPKNIGHARNVLRATSHNYPPSTSLSSSTALIPYKPKTSQLTDYISNNQPKINKPLKEQYLDVKPNFISNVFTTIHEYEKKETPIIPKPPHLPSVTVKKHNPPQNNLCHTEIIKCQGLLNETDNLKPSLINNVSSQLKSIELTNKINEQRLNLQNMPYDFTDNQISVAIFFLTEAQNPSQDIKFPSNFTNDFVDKTSVMIKDDIKEKISYFNKKLENIENNSFNQSEKRKITIEMTKFIDYLIFHEIKIPIYNRDEEELKLLTPILNRYSEVWTNDLKEFFSINLKKVLYLPEQYYTELDRLCKGKSILENYGSNLPESLFLEVLRRGGVLINNDAMYIQDDIGTTVVKKECEGFSIHNDVYNLLSKKPQLFIKHSPYYLIDKQIEEIRNGIINKCSKVYKQDLSPEKISNNIDTLIPSGDEIHMKIVVEYTTIDNEKKKISYSMFTSATDSGTMKLFWKQPFNLDIAEQRKAQNIRFQLVNFEDCNNISEYKEATQFINNTSYEGHNINQRIIDGFKNFEQVIKTIPIRETYIFNRTFLQKVGYSIFDEKIHKLKKDLNNLEKELNNLQEYKKKEKLDEYRRQEKNQFKKEKEAAILKTSLEDIKKIIINRNKLEEEERKYNQKNKATKVKIINKNDKN